MMSIKTKKLTSRLGNKKIKLHKYKKVNSKKVQKNNNINTKKNYKHIERKTKKRTIQGGGYNKAKTVCAPYMIQNKLFGKGIENKGKKNVNGTIITAEKGKKIEVIPTVHPDSCMGHNELMAIINAWNSSYPDGKIMKQGEKGLVKGDDKLWEELRNKIDNHITHLSDEGEHEWWEQDFVKQKLGLGKLSAIQDSIYAPEAPESWLKNPNTWLNTIDIEDVLKQYETKYPEFKSFGASPIDFDLKGNGKCQVNSLCNISMDKLMKGTDPECINKQKKKYIGVVFNLDKHYENGSHWIALFVNIPKGEINYWDSYGYEPPKEVIVLMDKIKGQLGKVGVNAKIQENDVRHQYKNSECGVYSLHFIIKQLEGKSYNEVCNTKISDDEMTNYRQKIFTNAK